MSVRDHGLEVLKKSAVEITPGDPSEYRLRVEGTFSSEPPVGGATEAKQDVGNASLSSIDTKLTNPLPVSGPLTDAQLRATPVPVSASIDTTGLATSARQDTGNTSLGSIDTKLSSQATAAKQDTGNASLSSIDTKLTGPFPVTDNGGSLTVDGPLTDTQLRATAVPVSETYGVLSTANSTTVTLGSNATFTGTSEDTTNYVAAAVALGVDRNGTLNVDFSPDGTNWDQTQSYTITVASPGSVSGFYFQFMCEAKYIRLRYVNGATAQGVFRLQTIFKTIPGTAEVHAVNTAILANTDALTTKGVIYGLSSGGGGTYVAVKVSPSGSLQTALGDISGVVGQNTMANSLPVSIASNQSAIPITDNSGSLTVDGPLTNTELRAAAVDISAASLPLPSGAATSANQTNKSQMTKITDGTSEVFVNPANTVFDGTHPSLAVAIDPNSIISATVSGTVSSQLTQLVPVSNIGGTGSSLNAVCFSRDAQYYRSFNCVISSTGTLTAKFQCSQDNSTWDNLPVQLVGVDNFPPVASIAMINGNRYIITGTTKLRYVRCIVSAYTSGTLTTSAYFYPSESVDGGQTIWTREQPAGSSSVSNVAASASNVTLLSLNYQRIGATVFNDSTAILYLKCGATASTSSFTVKIFPNGYWETPSKYNGIIDGIWDSATGNARVTEYT